MTYRLSNFLKISVIALAAVFSVTAAAIDFAGNSLLASGKWVKIRVTEPGIQQISYDQLRDWGFDNPEAVTVFGRPGTMYINNNFSAGLPDDLQQTPSIHTADGRVLFYGIGDTQVVTDGLNSSATEVLTVRTVNPYAEYSTYFLTDSAEPMAIDVIPANGGSDTPLTSHFAVEVCGKQNFPLFTSSRYFSQKFAKGSPVELSFPIKDHYPVGARINNSTFFNQTSIRYTFFARGASDVTLPNLAAGFDNKGYNVNVSQQTGSAHYNVGTAKSVSDEDVRFSTGTGFRHITPFSGYYPENAFPDGEITLSLNPTTKSSGDAITFGALEHAVMVYPRKNTLAGNAEQMMHILFGNTSTPVSIAGATAATNLWLVNDLNNIRAFEVSLNENTGIAKVSLDKIYTTVDPARMIAFDANAEHHAVTFDGAVENQNIHAMDTPDMVIITTAGFYDKANELADAHRRVQGMDVLVIPQEKIFNEFSSGTPTIMGYRMMLKMLFDRNPEKLKYLLLYGAARYDALQKTINPGEYLLTYITDRLDDIVREPTAFASDSYFGMLDDAYDHSKIYFAKQNLGVGRLPFTSLADMDAVNRKIINVLDNPASPETYGRGIFISGGGNEGAHYAQSQEAIGFARNGNPAFTVFNSHAELFAGDNSKRGVNMVKLALQQGAGYLTYSGHGGSNGCGLWNANDVKALSYNTFPLAVMTTCISYVYQEGGHKFVDEGLTKPDGGFIGVVGSSNSVYLDFNMIFNDAMAHAYASARYGDCVGDVFARARTEANNRYPNPFMEANRNNLAFNLAGDPAIPVSFFYYGAEITAVGDEAVDPDNNVYVKPMVPASLAGKITLPGTDGTIASDFNGTVIIEVYEAPRILSFPAAATTPAGSTVTLEQDLLVKTSARVVNGSFTASLICPPTAQTYMNNRVVITAIPDEGNMMGHGSFANLSVVDYDPEAEGILNADAPVINSMYIDSPDFVDGQDVPSSFTLYADITAPAGIRSASGQVGAISDLFIDGKKVSPYAGMSIIADADGNASLVYNFSDIAVGPHTIALNICDNQDQRTQAVITFSVFEKTTADSRIVMEEGPVRISATFAIEDATSDISARYIVEDAAGKIVYTATDGAEHEWNLKDAAGTPVTEGHYSVYAIFSSPTSVGSTPRHQFIILR